MFDLYPYTNFHELNQDWILSILKKFENELKQAIDYKTIHYADPLQWNITTQYAPNTVVVDENTGIAYISKDSVPSGILLSDKNYWIVIFDYQKIYNKIMSGVAFNEKDNETASKDLLVNDLVWYHGDLYRVTKAISEGSRYIVGTNVVATTIESLLSTYYGRDRVAHLLNDTVNVSGDYTINAGDIAETANHVTIHSKQDTLLDADGNNTVEVGGKLTERVVGSREIDVNGDDSVHIDGVTSINRGGAVTAVYASSVDKRVKGAFTESFEDTSTSTYSGKKNVKAKDITVTADSFDISQNNNKTLNLTNLYPLNMVLYGCDNTGSKSCVNDINAAVTAGNINLFFPSGIYLIDKPLSLPGNVTLVGCNATFKMTDNGSITLESGENGYISHFIFDGNSVCPTGLFIDTNAAGIVLESCYFSNFTSVSVKIGNTVASGGHQWLVNCKIYNPDTMATCLDILHPDVKLIGCELYYSKKAINLRTAILFLDSCHIWSGGRKANNFDDDVAIYCNKYAELNIVNTYIDSFLTGITGLSNIIVQGKNLYFYWDSERTYSKTYAIGILLSTWSKYDITYICNKSASITVYPVSYINYSDFIDSQPEPYLKREYSPDNARLPALSTATAATMNNKRTLLFKTQIVTANTWYHCGWIVPSSNDWLNFTISDGKNNCTVNMYFDKQRDSANINGNKNTISSDSWDFGIGKKETLTIADQNIIAYPIFIRPVASSIYYSLFMFNKTSSWISIFNGTAGKTFNSIYTLLHS